MACSKSYRKSTIKAYSIADQVVAQNANVEFDNFSGTGCSIRAMGSTGVEISKPGLYLVTVNASCSEAGTAGDITLQLNRNGVAIPGALATDTSAAETSIANVSFCTILEVLSSCACVDNTTMLTIENIGVNATIQNVEMNVVKLC